jgi:predicted MPP superfamily phosphohydrolase
VTRPYHFRMPDAVAYLLFAGACVGHAAIWVPPLNDLYGRRVPKGILKPLRALVGVTILAGWVGWPLATGPDPAAAVRRTRAGDFGPLAQLYLGTCLLMGLAVFPAITAARLLRKTPAAVVAEHTRTLDLWPEYGPKLLGDGKYRLVPRLPFNCVFKVDFTDLALALPGLPPAWDGLTILHLTDLHFIGTPSRLFYERVIDELAARGPADVVALTGDYVDSLAHHRWVIPLLGRLKWREAGLAVLGNHDKHFRPDRIRRRLGRLGYRVLGNRWEVVTVRGLPLVAVGHEGPWFHPGPDVSGLPAEGFRLLLSHAPDPFAWAVRHRFGLMLAGHVHGGQVRLPVVGSIFVPSTCGRRYDMGTFAAGRTVLHVGRGLSGKEPLRFRCHPQVTRITLRVGRAE